MFHDTKGRRPRRSTETLLLNHGQLQHATRNSGDEAGREPGPQLFSKGQIPRDSSRNNFLHGSGKEELQTGQCPVVRTRSNLPAVHFSWIYGERLSLLSHIFPKCQRLRYDCFDDSCANAEDGVLIVVQSLKDLISV